MNKPIPWNINGVGFDAREAARDAARRQGKSLGEWLHGVIADHAGENGADTRDMGSQQRIEAVTSKLESLSRRSSAMSRPEPRDDVARWHDEAGDDETPRRARTPEEGRRRRDGGFDADNLLEEAVEAMERRARRAERRTDDALRSFADMLERNETQRDRERQSVNALADKLGALESRLTDRFADAAENPIKGALARLEARLETIGRRSAAEAAAAKSVAGTEPLHRLEEKLNTILKVVHAAPPASAADISPFALAASHAARPAKERRLGEAIADISRRQRALDADSSYAGSFSSLGSRLEAMRPRLREEPQPLAAVQSEIAALAGKIEDLRHEMAEKRAPAREADFEAPRSTSIGNETGDRAVARIEDQMQEIRDLLVASSSQPSGVEHIERQLASLNERLDRQLRAPLPARDLNGRDHNALDRATGELMAPTPTPDPELFGQIEARLERLAAKIDLVSVEAQHKAAPRGTEAPNTDALEMLVRDLATRMDAVRAPGSDDGALEALQEQITRLASRFETTDMGLAKLGSLERSMRELFAHLDATRASVETSAASAAREVLRIAVEEGRAASEKGTATSLAAVKALQEDADARTNATLSAVHETLEKVVDRLSVMERDIDDVRRRPVPVAAPRSVTANGPTQPALSAGTAPAKGRLAPEALEPTLAAPPRPGRPKPADIALGVPDPFLDQVLGGLAGNKGRKPAPEQGEEGVRADFIAAARRAAKAAQSDASLSERKAADDGEAPSATRANLIAQSRAYVSRHKRPVLISLAALFVVVGTMALMQRMGLGGSGDAQVADASAPAPITESIDNRPQPSARPRSGDALSPSALPKTHVAAEPSRIPGSDPIQTGSIPSLPAFAGGLGASAPPRPTLPAGLTSMAAAGDGPAEYVLGMHYAEGRAVPRDFKTAAGWYQRAAAQGLAPAQYRLAALYEKGLGVQEDRAKAQALYLQAAEAGNPRAMHNLAVLLADGAGKPDYDGAATWFRKAAQYGIHDSQYNLAILLARGLGVQQSLVQSYQWFAIAAAQNDADAAKKRDEVGSKLSSNDLAVAKALAAAFRPRVADVAATEVQPPPGGWDGAVAPTPLNSARQQKISSL